jgi:hypothetical protein
MGDGTVIVEFFGVPRLRAERTELAVAPGTLASVLTEIASHCPGLSDLVTAQGRLARHYLLSLDGRAFVTDLAATLSPGTRLLLLSADAGG